MLKRWETADTPTARIKVNNSISRKENKCDCPYTDWCHEVRQWLRGEFRRTGKEKTIEDCDFFKIIKERSEGKK